MNDASPPAGEVGTEEDGSLLARGVGGHLWTIGQDALLTARYSRARGAKLKRMPLDEHMLTASPWSSGLANVLSMGNGRPTATLAGPRSMFVIAAATTVSMASQQFVDRCSYLIAPTPARCRRRQRLSRRVANAQPTAPPARRISNDVQGNTNRTSSAVASQYVSSIAVRTPMCVSLFTAFPIYPARIHRPRPYELSLRLRRSDHQGERQHYLKRVLCAGPEQTSAISSVPSPPLRRPSPRRFHCPTVHLRSRPSSPLRPRIAKRKHGGNQR